MKRGALLIALVLGVSALFAQNKILVHKPGETVEMLLTETDSMYFSDEGTVVNFSVAGSTQQFYIVDVDSITFAMTIDSSVFIHYNGTNVEVINPLEAIGVSVDISGADVTVNSTADFSGIKYFLYGSTSDGMFKIYSEKKFDLILNGVEITNNDGPAINIQSSKKVSVFLEGGTESLLTDGQIYAEPPGGEDQEAAFFSEGQLVFSGSGSLVINGAGTEKDGLRSDDYIEIKQGNITVSSADNDGVHAKDGFFMSDGSVGVTSNGDGIDGGSGLVEISGGEITVQSISNDVSAIKSDSTMSISGGTLNISVAGDQSKGLKSIQAMILTGGTLDFNTTGGVVLIPSGSGYDPTYCTAIKGTTQIIIDGSSIEINSNGEAGRGITCDGDISISSGMIHIMASGDGDTYTNIQGQNDAYHGACLNADGNITITGGDINLSHSGDAGKGISTDNQLNISGTGTVISVTTTGQRITISQGGPGGGTYDEAKAITTDGAITIENGDITITSADDGMKSTESITINNGVVNIVQSVEGIESPNIFLNGGEISLKSSDDGLNATYGNGGEQYDGSLLSINGGYIFLNSTNGDPLDSNGDIEINGGTTVVHGPQSSPEVGMDVNGSCWISGGFLVVSGTNSFMTEGASPQSTQHSVLFRTNQSQQAGKLFHIEDANGNYLLTFAPLRTYYSIIFSSSGLVGGGTYKVYTGGTCTGTPVNGLYTGGTYSGGTLKTTFTLSSMAPTIWF